MGNGNGMGTAKIALLLENMLSPKAGERLLFITDYPDNGKLDDEGLGRRRMVEEWHAAAKVLAAKMDLRLLPLALYRETGKNNAELPKTAATVGSGHVDDLPSLIASANIVIAMTKYSASAPLKNLAKGARSLRVVSMPGIRADMEPAMHADYERMAKRGKALASILSGASSIEVTFDGAGVPRGTKLEIDVRAGGWIVDAGECREPGDFINFPSGEVFAPPYEGTTPEGRSIYGESKTGGIWPVYSPTDGKIVFLRVEKNRIDRVQGDSEEAHRIIENIAQDENNANIAEIGLGINENARSGAKIPVLESEKSGPHIAYGRNDHFGSISGHSGKVKASMHQDFVYAQDSPINATIYAIYPNGKKVLVAARGKIVAV